jgi:hypothetical protein
LASNASPTILEAKVVRNQGFACITPVLAGMAEQQRRPPNIGLLRAGPLRQTNSFPLRGRTFQTHVMIE